MKVVFINKSDARGGAAVVTHRLCSALRAAGVDARMLVVEKLTHDSWVEQAASPRRASIPFISERLQIYMANGFNRRDLFKADTAQAGLPLWHHPLVREADVVCLGWWNQGMLSLHGVRRIAALGKPIIQTMHDMWSMTAICHHAGGCMAYRSQCSRCPLLGRRAAPDDLSAHVWEAKHALVRDVHIRFVPVSRWLARMARSSGLLGGADIHVIPNAFPVPAGNPAPKDTSGTLRVAFGAARLDDDIKGLPILLHALRLLRRDHPKAADRIELVTFGDIRDSSLLDDVAIRHSHAGTVTPGAEVARLLDSCHIIASSSYYETLPGTLIEGQAEGCWPVAFDRGGQADIIRQGVTGTLVPFGADSAEAARNLAAGIITAADTVTSADSAALVSRLRDSVRRKFSAESVASRWLGLLTESRL